MRLRFRKNAFNCRFDAKRIKGGDLPVLAGRALARLLQSTDGSFLKRCTILSMRIPTPENVQVVVMADLVREQKHDLMLAGITAWVRVVVDQPLPQRQEARPPGTKRRHRAESDARHASDAPVQVRTVSSDRLEREQDASREYAQIRDHGQFGSYPSHDDYDS